MSPKPQNPGPQHPELRLDELEARLAFQDDLIENLNDVVARQDQELVRLTRKLANLEERLQDLATSASGSGESSGHEVPPHY
jgi:SlyX protein